ncbi:hypothetical protein HDU96_001681 [Phlyctochytrium bullatum]|nr:hypothetical protein HDU96_001681 [Phlyctochytrium bullatum]
MHTLADREEIELQATKAAIAAHHAKARKHAEAAAAAAASKEAILRAAGITRDNLEADVPERAVAAATQFVLSKLKKRNRTQMQMSSGDEPGPDPDLHKRQKREHTDVANGLPDRLDLHNSDNHFQGRENIWLRESQQHPFQQSTTIHQVTGMPTYGVPTGQIGLSKEAAVMTQSQGDLRRYSHGILAGEDTSQQETDATAVFRDKEHYFEADEVQHVKEEDNTELKKGKKHQKSLRSKGTKDLTLKSKLVAYRIPQKRRRWEPDELLALEEGMKVHGTHWAGLLSDPKFKERLKDRGQMQLKDKAATEKERRIREARKTHGRDPTDEELGIWRVACDRKRVLENEQN